MSRHAARHLARRTGLANPLVSVGILAAVAFVGTIAVAPVLASGSGTTAAAEPRPTASAPVAAETSQPVVKAAATPAAIGRLTGSVTPEAPRRAVLPSGEEVPVVPVSTTDDGTLDVPGDITTAGWWRGGSRIGDPFGSSLVAAHVDSTSQGLGPYAELLSVRPGETVVLESEHLRQEYVVSSLRLLDKGTLSDHPWVYSATGPHRLVMVTCAGPFVPAEGGYQRLAVVTATAVGEPTPKEA